MPKKIIMSYQGVKFRTEMIDQEAPSDCRLEELKKWCTVFHEKGLAPPYEGGSCGNLSFRIKEGELPFIITGSRIGIKLDLKNDCFVIVVSCDLENKITKVKGTRDPSSEAMLHFAIYQKRPDVNAVFHGHCREISSNAKRLGIPVTKKEEHYGTLELVKRVLDILDKNPFLEMKNHGFISMGKTMEEAGELALKMCKRCV